MENSAWYVSNTLLADVMDDFVFFLKRGFLGLSSQYPTISGDAVSDPTKKW